MRTSLIYLASPYSSPDPDVRERRFHAACDATVYLIKNGFCVFSPIVHSHPLAWSGLPWGDHDLWRDQDAPFLAACQRMIVLMLPGWQESEGVQDEIRDYQAAGKLIEYIEWPPKEKEEVWP